MGGGVNPRLLNQQSLLLPPFPLSPPYAPTGVMMFVLDGDSGVINHQLFETPNVLFSPPLSRLNRSSAFLAITR